MGLKKFFLKFLCHVVLSVALVFVIWFALLLAATSTSAILPANQAENDVANWLDTLDVHQEITPSELPSGIDYLIQETDGTLLSTSLSGKKLKTANHLAASDETLWRKGLFPLVYQKVSTEKQTIIVVYQFRADFRNPLLRKIFPNFDLLMLILLLIFSIADLILVSSRHAKKLQKELLPLQEATEQIQQQNLDFEIERSHILEFNHVLDSLDALKDELKHSLKKQWESEQLKRKQMAALAHDIKTPLTIVRGNTELLQECDLDEEQAEYVAFINENTQQIGTYINRMIEVSKDNVSSSPAICDNLPALLTAIQKNAESLCLEKKLCFSFSGDRLPDTVSVAEDALKRALMNLIDNAVQYSPVEGNIILTAQYKKSSPDSGLLVFQVSDEGPGFSDEALQYATTEFYRADESRSDRSHFGLGLAITKQFISAAGGELQIENRTGGGAMVTITIPILNPVQTR